MHVHDIYNPPTGTIWEPRAFWDVVRIDGRDSGQIGGKLSARFNKQHFRNQGRFPVELDHILIAPVGYAFNAYDGQNDPPVLPVGDFGACAAVIQKSEILISVPNRQHYSFDPLPVSTWTPRPVADIPMDTSPTPFSSGMLGVCRWDFEPDRRLVLPRNANCTLQLGAYVLQPAIGGGGPRAMPAMSPAHLAFWEEGTLHEGSKQFPWNAHTRWRSGYVVGAGSGNPPAPFPPADGLGFQGGTDGQADVLWPGVSALSFKSYKEQEKSRAGHNSVGGFAVHIDQTENDDAIDSAIIPPGGAIFADVPVAPISLRVPSRARCDAMSQEWWWREGAPLALVCPSLGPAQVYRLPRKITLHKGDVLEVELQVPGGIEVDSQGIFSIFQIGISFTGYAAIQG
jgi:hypothetical protein